MTVDVNDLGVIFTILKSIANISLFVLFMLFVVKY